MQAELRCALQAAIAELPQPYRVPLLLHDVDGLSNPEIAETLGVTLAWVKSRVHRARILLRSRLAAYVGTAADLALTGAAPGAPSPWGVHWDDPIGNLDAPPPGTRVQVAQGHCPCWIRTWLRTAATAGLA